MNIIIGADHRGFQYKQTLKSYLESLSVEVFDVGAERLNPVDDYTVYAQAVSEKVVTDSSLRGILLCGSGAGVDIVANKFDGVRATVGLNEEQVTAARSHDDINVLVIAADYVSEQDAKNMVDAFLNTEFDQGEHHVRRLEEIKKIEQNN